MIVKANGGDYEQAPTGTHVARCVRLIDIGTQESEYEGRHSSRRQVIIGWELPEETMSKGDAAGQPFLVTKFYTLSLNEKAKLREDLVSWRGRDFTEEELAGFDMATILGVPCLLGVIDRDGKSRVDKPMKLTKGMKVKAQINPTLFLSLEPSEFDGTVYEGLSDGIKKMVEASPEWAALQKPKASTTSDDEWPEEDGPELDFGEDDEEPEL